MKKIFASLLFLSAASFLGASLVRAQEGQSMPDLQTSLSSNTAFSSIAGQQEIGQGTVFSVQEGQEGDEEQLLTVQKGSLILVALAGKETIFNYYSSGTGDRNMDTWVCNDLNNPYVMNYSFFTSPTSSGFKPGSYPRAYQWGFSALQEGITTLTFQKYHSSNAHIFNLDGSSPWKNPTKELKLTITVVGSASQQ